MTDLGKLDAECVAALRFHAREVFDIQTCYVDPDADLDVSVPASV